MAQEAIAIADFISRDDALVSVVGDDGNGYALMRAQELQRLMVKDALMNGAANRRSRDGIDAVVRHLQSVRQ